MTLEEMLSECNMGIRDDICTMCSIECDWMSEIDAVLESEFPEEFTVRTRYGGRLRWPPLLGSLQGTVGRLQDTVRLLGVR